MKYLESVWVCFLLGFIGTWMFHSYTMLLTYPADQFTWGGIIYSFLFVVLVPLPLMILKSYMKGDYNVFK